MLRRAWQRSKAESKPFYLNLWFHISHAPMRPTAAQYQALADCEYLKYSSSVATLS